MRYPLGVRHSMRQPRNLLKAIALLSFLWGSATPGLAAFVQPTRSDQAMVVSAHPLATSAGISILRQGGNAVDAAIATAFAISVVEPFSAGLGGGGFALIHQNQLPEQTLAEQPLTHPTIAALDFRERAPRAAHRAMYINETGEAEPNLSRNGHLAVGVPGTVAGLKAMHGRYGKLDWEQLIQPAVALANQGFAISNRLQNAIAKSQERLGQNPAAAEIFLASGQPQAVGDPLKQPDLAKTLRRIAQDPSDFYRGEIAAAIAADMTANRGLITRQDLENYQPIWRAPICGPFSIPAQSSKPQSHQYEVCSMPPPSSGGVHLLQMLNLLQDSPTLQAQDWHHPDSLHWLVEVMKIAYADRAEHLGDPDFFAVPVAALTSPGYAALRRQEIDPQRARPPEEVNPADNETLARYRQYRESEDTTHLTVVDGDRNAVSMTFTINGRFGAGVVAAETGIVLNNEMDDFAIAPGVPNLYGLVGGEANAIAPGKTPLSSMTPTIVLEAGQFRLAAGAPGGSTIITTVLQVLLNALVYDLDAGGAIAAPRLHHQWQPKTLSVERWGFDALTLENLRQRGHEIRKRGGWGNGNLIQSTPAGKLEGAADPRGEGIAEGI